MIHPSPDRGRGPPSRAYARGPVRKPRQSPRAQALLAKVHVKLAPPERVSAGTEPRPALGGVRRAAHRGPLVEKGPGRLLSPLTGASGARPRPPQPAAASRRVPSAAPGPRGPEPRTLKESAGRGRMSPSIGSAGATCRPCASGRPGPASLCSTRQGPEVHLSSSRSLSSSTEATGPLFRVSYAAAPARDPLGETDVRSPQLSPSTGQEPRLRRSQSLHAVAARHPGAKCWDALGPFRWLTARATPIAGSSGSSGRWPALAPSPTATSTRDRHVAVNDLPESATPPA